MGLPDHILIIGAGASGLITSRELSRAGKKVTLLEGRSRTGGRIHTLKEENFPVIEAGAEFIHGELPVTLSLLREYGINIHRVKGDFWQASDDKMDQQNNLIAGHHRLLHRYLHDLKDDMTVENFLSTFFEEDDYVSLKRSVRNFVRGYDTADPARASVLAFRDEWENEDGQYRIEGGYGKLTDALARDCERLGCLLHAGEIVTEIKWSAGEAEVLTASGQVFKAEAVVATVPPPLVAGANGSNHTIRFSPEPAELLHAFNTLGYGGVIKTVLHFDHAFWKDPEIRKHTGRDMDELFFIFSGQEIPTWWTQFPEPVASLTGWLGGPHVETQSLLSDATMVEKAVKSLSGIFRVNREKLFSMLKDHRVFNWSRDPFTGGAYSYVTVDDRKAKTFLSEGIAGTLFFAGEAVYHGEHAGTVEAALSSGFATARKILSA